MEELKYLTLEIDNLPCGKFYPHGILIKFRACMTKEIESYSMADVGNLPDIREKIEMILKNNIIIKDDIGNFYDYNYLKQADREYMLFIIREFTFQSGSTLAFETTCKFCQNKYNINYRITPNNKSEKTIYIKDITKQLTKYYDTKKRCFKITINETIYSLAPPSIGLVKSLKKYKNVVNDDSFLKIIAYLLPNVIFLTIDEISSILLTFKKVMDMRTYQVINRFISKLDFGFDHLKSTCKKCKSINIDKMINPYDVNLFDLFKVDLMNFIGNEFEFWYKKNMNLDYLENLPYWKYEEFVKKLNSRQEEDNKRSKEENQQQNNAFSGIKAPKISTPKI